MQEQANTVRQLRPGIVEVGEGLFSLSEDLIEAGQKCRAAFWALRGMEAADAEHRLDTYTAVAELVSEAEEAIVRARRACFPEEFEEPPVT